MIKFDKMNSEEVSGVIRRSVCIGVLLAVAATLAGLSTILNKSYAELAEQDAQLDVLYEEKQQLIEDITQKTTALADLQIKDTTDLLSREELVVLLGDCARESGVSIVGLDSAQAELDDSVTKYNFVFEVKGTTAQIADTLAGIDARKLHYAVNEVSLRQVGDYLWLQRNFDEQITWWDISNITATGGFQSRANITAGDIIGDDIMTLYLDLDFIFVTSADDEAKSTTEALSMVTTDTNSLAEG